MDVAPAQVQAIFGRAFEDAQEQLNEIKQTQTALLNELNALKTAQQQQTNDVQQELDKIRTKLTSLYDDICGQRSAQQKHISDVTKWRSRLTEDVKVIKADTKTAEVAAAHAEPEIEALKQEISRLQTALEELDGKQKAELQSFRDSQQVFAPAITSTPNGSALLLPLSGKVQAYQQLMLPATNQASQNQTLQTSSHVSEEELRERSESVTSSPARSKYDTPMATFDPTPTLTHLRSTFTFSGAGTEARAAHSYYDRPASVASTATFAADNSPRKMTMSVRPSKRPPVSTFAAFAKAYVTASPTKTSIVESVEHEEQFTPQKESLSDEQSQPQLPGQVDGAIDMDIEEMQYDELYDVTPTSKRQKVVEEVDHPLSDVEMMDSPLPSEKQIRTLNDKQVDETDLQNSIEQPSPMANDSDLPAVNLHPVAPEMGQQSAVASAEEEDDDEDTIVVKPRKAAATEPQPFAFSSFNSDATPKTTSSEAAAMALDLLDSIDVPSLSASQTKDTGRKSPTSQVAGFVPVNTAVDHAMHSHKVQPPKTPASMLYKELSRTFNMRSGIKDSAPHPAEPQAESSPIKFTGKRTVPQTRTTARKRKAEGDAAGPGNTGAASGRTLKLQLTKPNGVSSTED